MQLGNDLGYETVDDVTAAMADNGAVRTSDVTPENLRRSRDGVLAVAPSSVDPLNDVVSSAGPRNSYDFRLVVSRKLYDHAVGVQKSPSLAHLAPGAAAHLHPLDIERAGAVAGADVTLTSPRGQPRPDGASRRVRAPRHGVGAVQPAGRQRRRHHRLHAPTSST